MLDPAPPPVIRIAVVAAGGDRQPEQQQQQQQEDGMEPGALRIAAAGSSTTLTRPSSMGGSGGSNGLRGADIASLRALVSLHLTAGAPAATPTTTPSPSATHVRIQSLPVSRPQQQQRRVRAPGAAEEGEEEGEWVEVVLDGGAAAGQGSSGSCPVGGEGEGGDKATCMICYTEDLPPEETAPSPTTTTATTTASSSSSCPHSYCRACVAAYLRTRVLEGRSNFPCPLYGESGCGAVYGPEHLATLLDADTLHRSQRLRALRADPSLRECPNPACGRLVPGGSNRHRKLTCEGCGAKFCWLHGQAHSSEEGCAAYERAARRAERASVTTVRRIAKRCPRCKAPTEKEGGCNHITCANCSHEWCWLCLAPYTPMHYSPTNLFFGCPGGQFLDVGAAGRGGAVTCCGCCPGAATAHLCRLLRLGLGLLLLPAPLLLGAAVALSVSLLWLPVGLAWAGIASLCHACSKQRQQRPQQREGRGGDNGDGNDGGGDEEQGGGSWWRGHRRPIRPHRRPGPLVRCLGGGWEALDLALPLAACTRAFRQGNGWWGTAYVLIFLGAAPLVIALACLLQLLWLPLAAAIMIVRVSRNRSCAASIILYPLTAAALVLNINGE